MYSEWLDPAHTLQADECRELSLEALVEECRVSLERLGVSSPQGPEFRWDEWMYELDLPDLDGSPQRTPALFEPEQVADGHLTEWRAPGAGQAAFHGLTPVDYALEVDSLEHNEVMGQQSTFKKKRVARRVPLFSTQSLAN